MQIELFDSEEIVNLLALSYFEHRSAFLPVIRSKLL